MDAISFQQLKNQKVKYCLKTKKNKCKIKETIVQWHAENKNPPI